MASPVVTLGFGTFANAALVVTLGFGESEPAEPVFATHYFRLSGPQLSADLTGPQTSRRLSGPQVVHELDAIK